MHAAHQALAAETLSAAQRRRRHTTFAATPAGGAAVPPSPPPGRQQWRQPQLQPQPQPHSPEMRVNPPWRRTACDRCRTQKLRCVRAKEDDTSRPCTRCLRIRYPCFTSSAKPPGRGSGRLPPASSAPTTASSAEAGSDAEPLANNTSASGRRKATVTRRRGASEDVSFAPGQTSPMSSMGMGMGWPAFSQEEEQNEEAGVFDDGGMFMLTPSDEYQPVDFLGFPVDKDPSGFDSVARFRPVPQALPPLATFTSASSPSEFRFLRELEDEPDGGAVDIAAGEDQARMPSQTPNPPVQHMQSPGVLLARLLESLSVQLVRLNTEPWDLGVLSVTGSTANPGELNLTSAAEALANEAHTFNPLFSILVSTEKLLDICKLFMAPERGGGADEASTAAGSAGRSGSKRRVLSMHEASESRSTHQGAAKRSWRPSSAVSSAPFPFSLPCSSSSSSSSSSSKRRESCPSLSSVPGLPTGQTTITAAQLLTVVSCYLQVVTIYDDIFSHLLFKLALPPSQPQPQQQPQPSSSTQHHLATSVGPIPAGTNVTPTSRQRHSHSHSHHTQQQQQVQPATHGRRAPMVPSLVLAGYSVPLNPGLRMRLLVEVVEHQFEQIEHALGLPGQYCVSTSHHHQQAQQQQHRDIGGGGGQGLLAGWEATILLEAVMEGADGDGDGDGDGDANAGRDSIGVVASLRESLGKAQRVRRRGD